jgi:hypothetical protein
MESSHSEHSDSLTSCLRAICPVVLRPAVPARGSIRHAGEMLLFLMSDEIAKLEIEAELGEIRMQHRRSDLE